MYEDRAETHDVYWGLMSRVLLLMADALVILVSNDVFVVIQVLMPFTYPQNVLIHTFSF